MGRSGGLWLSWGRPSKEQQQASIASSGGAFIYDHEFQGITSSAAAAQISRAPRPDKEADQDEELFKKAGFFVNRFRILLGTGPDTFHRAKSALLSWRQYGSGTEFVEPDTPIEAGTAFCICVKLLLPWVAMPLKVAYVTDISKDSKPSAGGAAMDGLQALFAFGVGSLGGNLLTGEEKFSVAWYENDEVWYEVFSFSKAAHPLSTTAYPYVQLRQKHFARESAQKVLNYVTAPQSDN